MFSEVVKLTPQIERSSLNTMFRTLNQRFGEVTRKFGQGFKNALKIGGIAAVAGAVLDKLLNPLQKAEEIIDRIINKGDDAVTNAEEFGTTPGKLLRLEAVAQSKGLNSDALRQMLGKFQSALAKEQEKVSAPDRIREKIATFETERAQIVSQLDTETDPAKREALQTKLDAHDPRQLQAFRVELAQAEAAKAGGGSLREFVNEKDTADAFFKFVQSIQKLDKSQQTVIQADIFGEKQRGKASEFLNATDLGDVLKALPSTEALTGAAVKTGKVADLKDLVTAVRDSQDFVTKSALIDESMVKAIDQSERLKNKADDQTLQRFDSAKSASIAIQELTAKFDGLMTDFVNNTAPLLVKGVNEVSSGMTEILKVMPTMKQITEWGDEALSGIVEFAQSASLWIENFPDLVDEKFEGISEKFRGAISSVETVWAEFKSSRIYRTFGGG